MTRCEFIRGASAAAMATAIGQTLNAQCVGRSATDYATLQDEIDKVTPRDFADYLSDRSCARSEYAALVRMDEAFECVLKDVRETTVRGRPAVWYVYNMGVIVKTPKTCFSIDLKHRMAPRIAPLLDFALITHNHGDHFTDAFYGAMNGAGKTVISNFKDNYGVKDWLKDGGYTRKEKTFLLGDVAIRTSLTDHNEYLVDFTTAFEIRVGDFVIYHSGDCSNVAKLNPTVKPDFWFVHPYCGLKASDGVRKFHPATTVMAHLNELGHARGRARWTYENGLTAKADVEAAGGKAIVPVWGDRIV